MLGFMLSGPRGNFSSGPSRTDTRNMAQEAVSAVSERLHALELACAGLWDLLKTKHGYTDEELVQAIRAVDGRAGAVDGKVSHATESCPYCKRAPLVRNPKKCSWCGAELVRNPL